MNRTILVVAFLLLAAGLAAAPVHAAGLACGVKAGWSYSHVDADLFHTDSRSGIVGGVYGAIPLTPDLVLQPELLYVRKGAKLGSTDVTVAGIRFGTITTTLDVDYLEVPVLLRMSAPTGTPADFRVLVGPVASFKMHEQLSTSGLVGVQLGTGLIKDTDLGLAIGAAAAMRSGRLHWVGEGRYTFGLSNVSSLPFGGDVKNGAFYAMLGLELPIGD